MFRRCHSRIAADDNLEGLLAKASAPCQNGAQAIQVLGPPEANLFFGFILPEAEKDVERPLRIVESIGAKRKPQTIGRKILCAPLSLEFMSTARQAVFGA